MADAVVVPQEVAQLGYAQLQMRKKIALQLLARQRQQYPRNVGEGLASMGQSMGDVGMMQMLQQQQAQEDEERRKALALQATGGV